MSETAGTSADPLESIGSAFADRFGEEAVAETTYGELTVTVPAEQWVAALELARYDLGLAYFDWLSAVDEEAEGFIVVAHVCSVQDGAAYPRATRMLVRTRIPAAKAELASATGVFRGANWHERETHEMFGITFTGHPNLIPLLLPDGFDGHPLRKDFVLASRVAKEWPGVKEPGEGGHGGAGAPGKAAPAATRRRMVPPGVPDGWLKPLPEPEPAPAPEPESSEQTEEKSDTPEADS
jgi:NADH-quinone oxidoreductase subunit C